MERMTVTGLIVLLSLLLKNQELYFFLQPLIFFWLGIPFVWAWWRESLVKFSFTQVCGGLVFGGWFCVHFGFELVRVIML